MAAVPGACPHCKKRTLVRHCEKSPGCTWLECSTCRTLVDRRNGHFAARQVVEKDKD